MAKMYYFSKEKHAHDIEFYRNRLFNTMCDMENGTIPMDAERYDRIHDMYYGELEDLYNAVCYTGDYKVSLLTGKQIGLAKKIVAWAYSERVSHCKPEYQQYC